jgi:hypothetical protein
LVTHLTPYHFGSPAGAEHFTDRREELALIADRLTGGQNVILHGPRRYGKTSLLHRAIEAARKRGGRVGYVNLLRCSSRREVAQAVTQGIFAGPLHGGTTRRMGRLVERLRVRPRLDFSPTGGVTVFFEPGMRDTDWPGAMEDACRLLAEASASHAVGLVLDEFQQIVEVDPALTGTFKAILDESPTVSYVIAGSHVHLMERLTTAPGAPLLAMGELLRLGPIPDGEMAPYLVARAQARRKHLTPEVALRICALGGPAPNDIQRLAQHSFDVAGGSIGIGEVEAGMALAVSRESTTFAERYERLAPVARRLLRLIAAPGGLAQPYGRAALRKVEMANANAVRKALASLEESEMIARRPEGWDVADPFFRRWLQTDP